MILRSPTRVHGRVEPGFEPVQEAFAESFKSRGELGASFCVYAAGKEVVDLWGGVADPATSRPYDSRTVQPIFSATKGAVAVCCAILADRGLLDYDAPVARYWPEFAHGGKQHIPVSWLLSHSAGLPWVDARLTAEDVLDGPRVTRALETQRPVWRPGEKHGYHALTFGWLAGELVRRISGLSVGRFFAEVVSRPLGLDFWIGLPPTEEHRIARLVEAPSPPPQQLLLLAALAWSRSAYWRTLTLNGALSLDSAARFFNRPEIHAAEIPAASGISDARSLARMYAATIGEVDGVRLFSPETLTQATTPQSQGRDRCLYIGSRFGLGFGLTSEMFPFGTERAFGHTGVGGAVGFADPVLDLAIGYVPNRMTTNATKDRRARSLAEETIRCASRIA